VISPGRAPGSRFPVGAATALAATVYAALVRPRLLTWGASEAELAAPYPGDELISEPFTGSTMATTIAAPPVAVWPWLVQMGYDRAGFYSWDRLDHDGIPSAERMHPEWQDTALGDRMPAVADGRAWFEVARLERERHLVLRARMSLNGRSFGPQTSPRAAFIDSTWGFYLAPAGHGTRLVVHGVGGGRPRALVAIANWLFWEPTHWIMQRKQFEELRRHAEAVGVSEGHDSSVGEGRPAWQAS
jgi:hypothetical protein